MANNRLHLFDLVKDNFTHLSSFLDAGDVIQFSRTSKHSFRLYGSSGAYEVLKESLYHIWNDDLEKARGLIQTHPGLLTTQTSFNYLPNVSPFQLAVWTLNHPVCRMMLECIPNNEAGLAIKQKLLSQYIELRDKGLLCKRDGKVTQTSHYDYSLLRIAGNSLLAAYKKRELIRECFSAFSNAQQEAPGLVLRAYCQKMEKEEIETYSLAGRISRFDKHKLIEYGFGGDNIIMRGDWGFARFIGIAGFITQAYNKSPAGSLDLETDCNNLDVMISKAKNEINSIESTLKGMIKQLEAILEKHQKEESPKDSQGSLNFLSIELF